MLVDRCLLGYPGDLLGHPGDLLGYPGDRRIRWLFNVICLYLYHSCIYVIYMYIQSDIHTNIRHDVHIRHTLADNIRHTLTDNIRHTLTDNIHPYIDARTHAHRHVRGVCVCLIACCGLAYVP